MITTSSLYLLCHLLAVGADAQAKPHPKAKPVPAPIQTKVQAPDMSQQTSDPDSLSLENSLSLRDPFQQPTMKAATDEGGKIPELERYSIEQFKLLGVITGPKKPKALVTTPDGKMHVLTERMKIGTRRGYIKTITSSTVFIEEKVVNILGQEERIETKIEFKDKIKDKL